MLGLFLYSVFWYNREINLNMSFLETLKNSIKDLNHESYDLILKKSVLMEFDHKEIIYGYNEVFDGVYIIEEGRAEISHVSFNSGRKQVVKTLKKGEIFGLDGYHLGVYSHGATAIGYDTKIRFLRKGDLESLFEDHGFLKFLLKHSSKEVIHLNSLVREISLMTVEERILNYLHGRVDELGHEVVTLGMTITDFANKLGTAREVVSRSLKNLEQKGHLQRDGHLITVNVEV